MAGENGAEFGPELARARAERGLSLAELSGLTFMSRGWINNVEAGRRWPDRKWVELADRELNSRGRLVETWELEKARRDRDSAVKDLLRKSERESRLLVAAQPDGADLDFLGESISDLAVAYLANPAAPMLEQAMRLRAELLRRTSVGGVRPHEVSDLYNLLGRVSGILAYAALDLGDAKAAMTHGAASWRMAEISGDNELKAWTRGTQSLIARFGKNYKLGQELIDDGLKYIGSGTAEVRLLCGAAQCAANLGDSGTARALLEDAERARERSGSDRIEGLFGFSHAKQAYYSASSLMWLPDDESLQIAEQNAEVAIKEWSVSPREQRSLDDEALAHVYLAAARIKLGEVEAAMDSARTVLDLPEERKISWIINRIAELGDLLSDGRFKNSAVARAARDELRSQRA